MQVGSGGRGGPKATQLHQIRAGCQLRQPKAQGWEGQGVIAKVLTLREVNAGSSVLPFWWDKEMAKWQDPKEGSREAAREARCYPLQRTMGESDSGRECASEFPLHPFLLTLERKLFEVGC